MLSGRITPTIYFGGDRYSISTLRPYCCIDRALVMPQSYYSSRAYSGCRPKTIGGTSLWASPEVSPDFSRKKFCELTILRLICSGSHTVFVVAGNRSCQAGGFVLTATLITSEYTIILTTMGGPTLHFRATTLVVVGRFYQRCDGSLKVIEARFQLIFKRSCRRGHN